jgi:hypothetical protein
MALEKRTIEIPLGQGVESKHVKYTVPPDRLKRCHNGRWSESNKIEKRHPYISLGRTLYTAAGSTAGAMTAATQLGECNSQALAVNAEPEVLRLCSCVDSAAGTWRQSNRLPMASCERSPVYHAQEVLLDSQTARCNGLLVTAFTASDYEIVAIVHDESSGEVAVAEKVLTGFSASTSFRLVALGTWVVCIYTDPNAGPDAGKIYARCLDTTQPSLGWAPPELVTGGHIQNILKQAVDARPVAGSTTDLLFAYNEDPAGLIVQRFRRDHGAATWSTIATMTPIAEVSDQATTICQDGSGDFLLLAWIGGAPNYRPRWTELSTADLSATIAAADLSTDNAQHANIITSVARPSTTATWAVLYDNGVGQELLI